MQTRGKIPMHTLSGFEMRIAVASFTWFLGAPLCAVAEEPPPVIDGETRTASPIVVTATRSEQRLEDVAANVTVIDGSEARSAGNLAVDDLLRQIPGFTLLRQASSLGSSNLIQAPSMRGIGGSAAARTLVLMDGVPLIDPFTSGMAWGQVPTERIERIEVLRGGGAGVWGNLAMGGVVHIMTETPQAETFHFMGQGGDNEVLDVDASYGNRAGRFSYLAGGRHFDTGGDYSYPDSQIGAVDQPAALEHYSTFAKGTCEFDRGRSISLSASYFEERTDRPTMRAYSEYIARNVSLATDWDLRAAGRLQATLFSTSRDREALTTSVSADRNSERPTVYTYSTPTNVLGANVQWSKRISPLHQISAGVDHQWLDAERRDFVGYVSSTGSWRSNRITSGNQTLSGAYVQDVFSPSLRWQIVAGARVDFIRQYNGAQTSTSVSSGAVTADTSFAEKDQNVFSPSLGAVFHATDELSIRTNVYQSFRAPTLSELYTGFRSGDVINTGNSELDSEHLTGGDLGAEFRRGRLFHVRVTGFWNEVEDAITQRTIGVASPDSATAIDPCGTVPAGGNCRQRDNVGKLRSRGIELDMTTRPYAHWTFGGSYYYADAKIVES
ncbi:MAG: TonB-dependent receptor, partial [Gemmatimonadetes bacterium]|nr:TonB-dependent receptor [Gemmatimonadota bacterium]